jgi:hypothetical protein
MKKLASLLIALSWLIASDSAWSQAIFNKYSPVAGIQCNTGNTYVDTACAIADLQTVLSSTPGVVLNSATGGSKGAGTINAAGLYVNGSAVGVGGGAVSSVGISVPSGSGLGTSGTPVTSSGTLGITFPTGQTNHLVLGTSTAGQLGLVALTAADLPGTITSNTSGNAATATALASVPSQCASGNFSTGVQASGNANCTLLSALTLPYPQTAAESAAGVTPVNVYIPSPDVAGYVYLERYGGAGNNSTNNNTPFANAVLVAQQTDAKVGLLSGGIYLFTTGISMTGGAGERLVAVGVGQATLSFSGLSSTTDCLTVGGGGSGYPQVELRSIIVNCNVSGRDGVVMGSTNAPVIENVKIENTERDGLALSVSGFSWIEKLKVQGLYLATIGRHGMRWQTAGTNGAYINEGVFVGVEIRGLSKTQPGGTALYMTSTATGSGSKFSDHLFVDPLWDSQYAGTGNVFQGTATLSGTVMTITAVSSGAVHVGDTVVGTGIPANTTISSFGTGSGGTGTYNMSASMTTETGEPVTVTYAPNASVFAIDSGVAQNFTVMGGEWESTGGVSPPGTAYYQSVTGSGSWGGYTSVGVLTNSFWSNAGSNPAVTQNTDFNVSFNSTALMGPVSIQKGVTTNQVGLTILSNNSATAPSNEIFVQRAGSTVNAVGEGPSIQLEDTTATTAGTIQHSGGQMEFWQYNGGFWKQSMYLAALGGLVIDNPSSGAGLTNNGSSQFNSNVTIAAPSSGAALAVSGVAGALVASMQGSTTTGSGFGLEILAGSNSSDYAMKIRNAANSTTMWELFGDGGEVLNSATGGDKGSGTINASGLYVNGASVLTGTAALKLSAGVVTIGTSTCTINLNSSNLASCAFSATGNAIITFTSAYSSGATCTGSDVGTDSPPLTVQPQTLSITTQVEVLLRNPSGSLVNSSFSITCIGN